MLLSVLSLSNNNLKCKAKKTGKSKAATYKNSKLSTRNFWKARMKKTSGYSNYKKK